MPAHQQIVSTVDEVHHRSSSRRGFLGVAAILEDTGVSAYAGAAPFTQDKEILAAALGIHSVEARHANYLNFRTGRPPAPVANDTPRSKDEDLKATFSFIVG
jgi:hypothetical protein